MQNIAKENVTVDQLLAFSAPIDLVERYQIYLDNPTKEADREIYYKCSSSYFGQFYQYRTFSDIVKTTFKDKPVATHRTMQTTCYTHLRCKRRLESSICLDWREICDGNPDCEDGLDERDCFLLSSVQLES